MKTWNVNITGRIDCFTSVAVEAETEEEALKQVGKMSTNEVRRLDFHFNHENVVVEDDWLDHTWLSWTEEV